MKKNKKDFIIPFSFENRRPMMISRAFIVPDYFNSFDDWKFDFSSQNIFKNNSKIFIEYCSGNGEWILEKAKKHPEINWIAVEKDFQRARKIWVKIHNFNIKNIFLVFSEAYTFTKFYLKKNSISSVFINFPDPWPKEKHKKNRLINEIFIKELSNILKKDCCCILVTDDQFSSKKMIEITISQGWDSFFKNPYFSNQLEGYGDSYFNTLWASKKRKIFYHKFLNKNGINNQVDV